MTRRNRLALPSAVCALLLAAGSPLMYSSTPASSPRRATATLTPGSLLRSLSLHDKIAQLIIVRGYGDYPPSDNAEYRKFVHWITDVHVGGFIIAGRIQNGDVIAAQPFEMAVFVNHMQRQARTPLMIASDFERGASMRVAETARFPYMMAFGAAHDLGAIRELGAATPVQARALGVNWVFAPDADVNNNPDNPIINVRSFGEDPQAVAQSVSAFIEGAHASPVNYILVSAKHFPGHGDTSQDSHLQLATLNQPKERIESVELVPFRAAIAHGADSIMTAHLAVPAYDPGDIPATVSPNILTGLLREELGFQGIIVTDALEMQGVAGIYSKGEAAVKSIEAGADVLLMPPDPEICIRSVMAAVASGRISRKQIDASVARVLMAKQRVGLFRSRTVDLDAISDQVEDRKLDALAQTVADRAVTLLKDDKHLFPMPAAEGSCLVVMSETDFSTRGEAMTRELKRYASGLPVYVAHASMPDDLLTAIAAQTSKCQRIYAAAFVTVAAGRGNVALEGGLNKFLQSLEHGPVPVALISLGNPYLLRDFPDVAAYAATFSTASTSEIAAAKAVLGTISVSGKMPVSIPGIAKVGDGLDVPARSLVASNGAE